MALRIRLIALSVVTVGFLASNAYARDPQDAPTIIEAGPVLAPFQHVRFCLRYPDECKSNPAEVDRIELTSETSELLKRVNFDVNAAIIPTAKDHGPAPESGWTIAPTAGDCNDYAVTKRHELLRSGLPAKALRLSVVKTASGIGHLVLVVVTSRGELVLDNLTDAIQPWQTTDYRWLKIQSASDARFWSEIKGSAPALSQANRKLRVANR
jgi:predicted transglutaminase-like cysteine proteinase